MRIVHLSYSIPKPRYTDPDAWLKKIIFSVGILEHMARYAEIIGIFHIDFRGVLRHNQVEYHFTGCKRLGVLLPFRFNQYVKKLVPDVVVIHGLISPWQVIMLRWQLGKHVKFFGQHHAEVPLRDVRQFFQRWADVFVKAYFFSSADLAKPWLAKEQISAASKVHEVMEASSAFKLISREKASTVTKVHGKPVYLWVGRLDENKNPLVLASSFVRFAKRNPDAVLYMIYQSVELEVELKKIATLSNAVHLVGQVAHAELEAWYNSADFIVSTSYYEGSGIAVCEAMSCGCIPILSDIPSFRMMTNNGGVGLLYAAGDEDALLHALEKSLSLDLNCEKEKVLHRFDEALSFEAIAKKMMNVIQRAR